MTKEHLKFLEKLYLSAPIQELYPDTQIKVKNKESIITMPILEKHCHAAKSMHGSVYFRLLDDAAFFAASSIEATFFILTASFKVKLLKPVTDGFLTSVGEVSNYSSSKIQAKSKLYSEANDLIATGEGIFLRSNILLKTLKLR